MVKNGQSFIDHGLLNQVYLINDKMSRLIEWFLHADNDGIIFGLTAKSTLYHMPGSLDTFIDNFILLINELPAQHRILTDGDFNLDQMLSANVAKVDPLIQNFNLSPHSQYSTHIHGGLLNHVLDTSNSNALSSLPSSYSDHFVLFLFFSKSDNYIYL